MSPTKDVPWGVLRFPSFVFAGAVIIGLLQFFFFSHVRVFMLLLNKQASKRVNDTFGQWKKLWQLCDV